MKLAFYSTKSAASRPRFQSGTQPLGGGHSFDGTALPLPVPVRPFSATSQSLRPSRRGPPPSRSDRRSGHHHMRSRAACNADLFKRAWDWYVRRREEIVVGQPQRRTMICLWLPSRERAMNSGLKRKPAIITSSCSQPLPRSYGLRRRRGLLPSHAQALWRSQGCGPTRPPLRRILLARS